MNKNFYITSAIPYVNAKPHIGHALEFIQTDVIARYYKSLGYEVKTLCGGDENALKNVQAAETVSVPVQKFVDENNNAFIDLTKALNVHYDVWQKGSDQVHHYPSSQKLWELCAKNGDIYRKKYEGLYCVGCETFYSKDELNEHGECFEHPGKKLEKVVEENYFFRLSKYQKQLVDLIVTNKLAIIPEFRKKEVLSFLSEPLHDISISRSNARAHNWGVPVPGDSTQRIYVWFDALNIYQSGIGFGWNNKEYSTWWPPQIQVIGKGIIRFHAVYWPAFLLSAHLKLPEKLFVHGYLTIDGQKMSKTIGNVVNPFELIKKYGVDSVRYYLLREIPSYGDGDFSERRFKEIYNADLANNLGNLVSRVTTLAEKYFAGRVPIGAKDPYEHPSIPLFEKERQSTQESEKALKECRFNDALESIWQFIKACNEYINQEQPWELAKNNDKKLNQVVYNLLECLQQIAWLIYPYLPETAQKIAKQLGIETLLVESPDAKNAWTIIKPGTKITVDKPLFPRLS